MKDMIEYLLFVILVIILFGLMDGGFTYSIDGVKHTVQFSTVKQETK